jgi:uncharacterized membrane protein HdeD (DUF308 family)
MSQSPMIERVQPPRWVGVAQAIAGIVIGLLLLFAPGASAVLIVQLVGLWWLIAGIVSLVSLAWDRKLWGWTVASGLLGIVAGLAIIRHPLWTTVIVESALFVFLGGIGVSLGVTLIARAVSGRDWGVGILGVVDVVIGLLLLFNPLTGVIALPILLGLLALIGGIAALVIAIRGPRNDASGGGGEDLR